MSGVLNLLLAGAASAIKDAYFNLTTLLLNTSSTNGAQNNTFLDSSTNNFTVTRNGNTTQGTFTPFSQTGWSNYFNGTGSGPYLRFGSSSALTFGTGDFTVEFWVYFLSVNDGTISYFYDMRDANGTGSFFVQEPANTFTYINGAGNSVTTGMTSSTFAANQWYHVAVCRASGVINFYVNGTKVSSNPADTSNYATSYISIMSRHVGDGGNNNTNSYTSNFRVVKGTAVYTSNFTPSTTPLTAISGTSLLTCQANRFVDNSGNALTVSVDSSLTPSVQAFSPFAPTAAYDTAVVGGSSYIGTTGAYLTVTSQPLVNVNDWTVEFWMYPTQYNSGGGVFSASNGGGTVPKLNFYLNGTNFELLGYSGSFYQILNTTPPKINQWTYVSVSRSSSTGNAYLYYNGVLQGSAATFPAITGITGGFNLLSDGEGSSAGFYGYMSNVRVSNTARYTGSSYSVPTSLNTSDANTTLLPKFINSGIFDSTAKNVLETVGNAQVSTTQAKWGTTSMYFDGTGDWLTIRDSELLEFGSGDFTVEAWVYPTLITGDERVLLGHGSGSTNWVSLYITSSATVEFAYVSSSSTVIDVTTTSTVSLNTWTHIALVRNGTSFKIYINGTDGGSSSSPTTSSSAIANFSDDFRIGGARWNGGSDVFQGYMDDFRISKYARYTANFTAPTAAFPLQ